MRAQGCLLFVCLLSVAAFADAPAQDCFRPKREKKLDAADVPMSLYNNDGYVRDTRKEIEDYAEDSACAKQLTQIACTVIPRDSMAKTEKGEFILKGNTQTMSERMNVCPDERFSNQLSPGTCSCFLTGDNEVMTAGHCFPGKNFGARKKGCLDSYIVFGFDMDSARKGYKFKNDQVFSCNDIDKKDKAQDVYKGLDVMRVRLNETAANRYRKPLDIKKMRSLEKPEKGRDLCAIGSPLGTPVKMALGQVKAVRTYSSPGGTPMTVIRSNLDGMAGTSGAMVTDCKTGALVGVYLSGASDLQRAGKEKCLRPTYYDSNLIEQGIKGENVIWVGNIPDSIWGDGSKNSQAPGVK